MQWIVALVLAEIAVGPYMAPGATFDPENGLLLHSTAADEGGTIHYERPVVVLPPAMTEGEIHTSQRRFALRVGGERRGVGAHYFEAELLGTESLVEHDNCLKIRRHALRMDFSGEQQGYDVIEWYARGKGVVRAEGERFWKDADGNVTRTEKITRSRGLVLNPRGGRARLRGRRRDERGRR